MKKILFLFLISFRSFADCPFSKDGISCKIISCKGHIQTKQASIDTKSYSICHDVYKKEKEKWVYDYKLIRTFVQHKREVFHFENELHERE